MKKLILISIFIIAFTSTAQCQSLSFKNENTFKKESFAGLKLIDQNKLNNYDFQLRFYFGPQPMHLLLITFKNNVWSNDLYTFFYSGSRNIKRVDSTHVNIKNYNALFKDLTKDSLLTMTTLDKDQFYKMAIKRKTADKGAVLFADGPGPYIVELLSPTANRGFKSQCPKTYYNLYHLIELKNVVAILERLMDLTKLMDIC